MWKAMLREWKGETQWEKIFAKHVSDEWLVSKIYKEQLKLNNKKTKTLQKLDKNLNIHLIKEDI